jgi:hypothetical protein
MALVTRHLAKKAERDNPPAGRFLDVDGDGYALSGALANRWFFTAMAA